VNLAVLGADAVTPEGTFSSDLVDVASAGPCVRNANQVVLVADSSKFRQTAFREVHGILQIHRVITDEGCPPDVRKWLEKAVKQVTYAKVNKTRKPDHESALQTGLEETQQRYRAWWAHEALDRCAIWVTAPRDGAPGKTRRQCRATRSPAGPTWITSPGSTTTASATRFSEARRFPSGAAAIRPHRHSRLPGLPDDSGFQHRLVEPILTGRSSRSVR